MIDILKVVLVIIGAFIGAGFSSGQEMYLFFFKYGKNGLIGLILSSFLIGIIINKTLKIIKDRNINTYYEFLEKTVIQKRSNKFNMVIYINSIINILLLITFFIMIAGFGAYFKQELNINSILGSSLLSILCFIIFMTNTNGMIKANEYLVPMLILIIFVIGIVNFLNINVLQIDNYLIKTNEKEWILKSILYSSYNMILMIPVLITLKSLIKDKRQIKLISILSSIIILILSIMIFCVLIKTDVNIEKIEMPVIYVIGNSYPILKKVYGIVILGSIFTTAISIGISFLQNILKTKKSYTQIATIMCITSVIISQFGFSNLVKILYPLFGYLGIIQIIIILKQKTNY